MNTENETPTLEETGNETLKTARHNMLTGLLWCVGGLAFTFLSYYFTEAGGRYVIATGAIVWGAIQAFNGLTAYLRIMRERGETGACNKAIAIAACTALAVGGSGYLSWRMVHADELTIVDHEQPYDCPELGIRFTLPAGLSEIATECREETDSTYAFYQMSAWNETQSFAVEGSAGNLADEGIVSVDEITEYLGAQAEEFFDAGVSGKGEIVETGGLRLLKHIGRRTAFPEWTTVMYDLVHRGSLLTLYVHTQGEDPEPAAAALLQSVELY